MPTIIWGILQQTAGAERESLRPPLELKSNFGFESWWEKLIDLGSLDYKNLWLIQS